MLLVYFHVFEFNWGAKQWQNTFSGASEYFCGQRRATWDESSSYRDRWDGFEMVEMVMRWLWDGFCVFSCFWVQLGCKTHCFISLSTFVACKRPQVPPAIKLRWFEMVWDGLRWFWDGFEMVLRCTWGGFEKIFIFEINLDVLCITWYLWTLLRSAGSRTPHQRSSCLVLRWLRWSWDGPEMVLRWFWDPKTIR